VTLTGLIVGVEPAVAAAIVVKLDRDHEREAQAAAPPSRSDQQEALGRLQPPERDWSSERVFAVRLRVPTGAQQLERMGLSGEEAGQRRQEQGAGHLRAAALKPSFRLLPRPPTAA
jgi:hypothetical protein